MCSCFFRFPASFLRSLYIRLNIRRDLCLDHAVIKSRVMVTPPVILFFRDLSCPEFLFFFRPGHQPRIQFRCFYSAFGNVGTETNQPVSVQDLDQFPILHRKQRVHQPIHGINVRNSDLLYYLQSVHDTFEEEDRLPKDRDLFASVSLMKVNRITNDDRL